MAQKFFSIETYSSTTGEITQIITSSQIGDGVKDFEGIQQYCVEIVNKNHCNGCIRNEFGTRVLDFNWSPKCENQICFGWESEDELNKFIKNHTKAKDAQTQIMETYYEYKKRFGDALILFRMGDFYETYHKDADVVANVLGITLTMKRTSRIHMAGFPHHALDTYLPKLIRAGHKVCICDGELNLIERISPKSIA